MILAAGLAGFFIGVMVMAAYGYSVAFLTLVAEDKRAVRATEKMSGA